MNPNEFDSFTGDDWWFFTGRPNGPTGNAGPAFNMQDTEMKRYPDGGPHNPFPSDSSATPARFSLFDLPIIAVDETSLYVSAFGIDSEGETSFNFSNIFIIPIEFDDGSGPKSMRDGDRPDESLITSIRLRDMDDTLPQYEKDFHVQHYPVQEPEPFEELENAQFFITIDGDTTTLQQKVRLAGLWFDASAPEPADHSWRYTQHLNLTSLELQDIDMGSGLRFWSSSKGYQVQTPDPDFHPATVTAFISSAVLTKDTQGEFRVFAAHHVYVDDGAGVVEGVAVQWYVIDPDLDNFRVVQDPPTWNPTLVASGRITTNGTTAGDCYHPVIGVTPQGAAIIEYTFSNGDTWPQVRRAALGNTYTSVASNTTVRQGPVNYSYTPSNGRWADYSDMQLDPSGCRLWSVHTLVHNPGGQPPVTITITDKRDVWLIEIPGNCQNANLNFDEFVDLLDLSLFYGLYAAGARRVDMDTDGRIDSADEALFLNAYQEATGP